MNAPVSRRALLGATAATAGAAAVAAVAKARIPVSDPAHPDADLFALLDRYPAMLAEADAAEAVSGDLWDAFVAQEPPRPKALHWKHDDGFPGSVQEKGPDGRWLILYDTVAVLDLRAAPEPTSRRWVGDDVTGTWTEEPDPRRCARRNEIIEAQGCWEADCEGVKARLGLSEADAAEFAAVERLDELTGAILSTPPRTTRGLGAKSKWAITAKVSDPTRSIWMERVLVDAVALAERGGASA